MLKMAYLRQSDFCDSLY